jgi:hypothetical protein
VISLVSQPISCSSEATFQEYGWGSGSSSSQAVPQAPKMSEQVTSMPSLAKIAWSWSLQLVRSCTSLGRYAEARIMPSGRERCRPRVVAAVKTSA